MQKYSIKEMAIFQNIFYRANLIGASLPQFRDRKKGQYSENEHDKHLN